MSILDNYIFYKEVKETLADGSAGYQYTKYKDYSIKGKPNMHPFPQASPDSYQQGLVEEELSYNANDQLLAKTTYE